MLIQKIIRLTAQNPAERELLGDMVEFSRGQAICDDYREINLTEKEYDKILTNDRFKMLKSLPIPAHT